MLKDHIIDYDDMVKAGQIAGNSDEIPVEKPDKKFAIIIKTAKAKIGKFDISDADAVRKSIQAIDSNPDLNSLIKKTAKYYIKQAADFFDIPLDWKVERNPQLIRIDEIEKDAGEPSHIVPILKIANDTYTLDSVSEIKQAEEALIISQFQIDPLALINGSRMLLKAASYKKYILHEDTAAFARGRLGNRIPQELAMRKLAKRDNNKYLEGIDILSNIYVHQQNAPVQKTAEFIRLLQDMDKIANFRPRMHGTNYANVLKDKPLDRNLNVDNLLKIAETSGDADLANLIE